MCYLLCDLSTVLATGTCSTLSQAYTPLASPVLHELGCEICVFVHIQTSGYPVPNIEWRRGGVAIVPDRVKFGLTNDSLIFFSPTFGDVGTYSCYARNNYTSASASTVIRVRREHGQICSSWLLCCTGNPNRAALWLRTIGHPLFCEVTTMQSTFGLHSVISHLARKSFHFGTAMASQRCSRTPLRVYSITNLQ